MRALALVALLITNVVSAQQLDASVLIQSAMDHWRGTTSYSEMTMTIHRTGWERTMSMRAWTAGDKQSLVRVTAPKKDAGNATLLDNKSMWTFSPKVNRIIKIPSSMMAQSWMGSDFSNKDISRSTEIIDDYTHTLTETIEQDGHNVYVITSVPHEDAAVVWGKEIWTIRDDFVVLEEQFWDQDGVLVKVMKTTAIETMGGRTVAKTMRMGEVESPQEWTEMIVDTIEFNIDLPANIFTQSNLRNPRQ
ncbi:MAG: outer membrane lipoprotein-sorting protein [Gammaproteobacteria bacterium]|nr:outer membrane lipoprotein-sorting protein [Gammaproteobacteria bacterium]